jgi:hypothetical protein
MDSRGMVSLPDIDLMELVTGEEGMEKETGRAQNKTGRGGSVQTQSNVTQNPSGREGGEGQEQNGDSPVGGVGANVDWRRGITEYLSIPGKINDRKIRQQALKYVMIDGELYRWTMEGLLLNCLNEEQSCIAMGDVHEGLCRAHQSAIKMKRTLRRAGYF